MSWRLRLSVETILVRLTVIVPPRMATPRVTECEWRSGPYGLDDVDDRLADYGGVGRVVERD